MTDIKNLHPLEIKVLLKYGKDDRLTSERLQKELGYKEGHANQAFSWLGGKGLLNEVSRVPHTYYELSDYGRALAKDGSIEVRIINFLKEKGAHQLPEISAALGIEGKDVGSAFGSMKKDGLVKMDGGKAEYTGAPLPERLDVADSIIKKMRRAASCTIPSRSACRTREN